LKKLFVDAFAMFVDRTFEFDQVVLTAAPRFELEACRKSLLRMPASGLVLKFVQAMLKSLLQVEVLIDRARMSAGISGDGLSGGNPLRSQADQEEFLCDVRRMLLRTERTLKDSVSKVNTQLSKDYELHQHNLLAHVRKKASRVKSSVRELHQSWARDREDRQQLEEISKLRVNQAILDELDEKEDRSGPQQELTERERRRFQQQNLILEKNLSKEKSEAEQAERRAVEIQEAITFFSENIAEQSEMVAHIYDNVAQSLEYVHKGNEQLKKAEEHGASTQATILIVLAVMTFSVLFLDWFHP